MGVIPVNKTLLDFSPNSSHKNESACRDFIDFCAKEIFNKEIIVYKKTDEWYSEWQRMTTSGTASDNEWQWVTASESNGTANENGTVHFKEWMIAIILQKVIHYYLKGWMAKKVISK